MYLIFENLRFSLTVKLGYNELGCNELPVITNKFFQFFQSQIHIIYIKLPGYSEFLVITNKYDRSQAVRYNRVSLYFVNFFIILKENGDQVWSSDKSSAKVEESNHKEKKSSNGKLKNIACLPLCAILNYYLI